MSLCVIALALTSAFCVVTSQEHGEAEGMINNMMMGGGAGRPLRGESEIEAGDPQAGPMKKFTLRKVDAMIKGMNDGFRYKYDGTPSTHEDDITISMEQLIAMKAQLAGTPGGTGKKQFTIDEVRMMLDGMNNGLRYNHQGQVTTVTEEVVFTVVELQTIMTELEIQEQILRQIPIDDVRRMVQGMETGGLQYNYQGQLAQEGQPTFSLPNLKKFVQQSESQAGSVAPTDIPSKPDRIPGQDLGTLPTAEFSKGDLERMLQGINNGLQYNYQGQIASPGQAVLTPGRINELLANLEAKGPMDVTFQTPNFTLNDITRMLKGMENGLVYNYQGLEARQGEPTLSHGYLSSLFNQLQPQGGMHRPLETASFNMGDITRMLTGMDNGLFYNYQGTEAKQGEPTLTRMQLEKFRDDLAAKGMGGQMQSRPFTLDDVFRMLAGMDNGLKYNYQGAEARQGEPVLTRDQLNQFMTELRGKGRQCVYKGVTYNDGERFMDDCNKCVCWNGNAGCTEMACGRPCELYGVIYKDGETFMDDCNTCMCRDGTAACTRMACPGRPCQHNGVEYKHDQSFMDDCNTCHCNDGVAACTLMACGRPCEYYGVTYRDGETFMDDCNTCMCRDGTAGCTRMACPGKPCLYNGVEYNHGDTFKDDCNTCRCNDGNTACTLMACGRTCAYKGVTYADGESFKDDCNTCMCSDGNVGCTRMACIPDGRPCVYNGISYNHGETFKDDCNTCTCSDGNAGCTLMACGRPCEYYGVTYQHGESFKDDCNTCMCRDGNAACTRMACPGRPCQHNGVEYKHGESFKDDCNTCRCNDGNAACTLMACGRPCEYYGVTYRDGQNFMVDCNTCMCRDGNIGCTEMACAGRPCQHNGVEYKHGQSFKDDCNTCRCNDGNAACTLMTCGRQCEYKGQTYKDGDSFMDDCNTCICRDGNAGCTRMACRGQCVYKGVTYSNGEHFMDDCNKCVCMNGNAGCTKIACGRPCEYYGVTYKDGETFMDDCNTCMCRDGTAGCTKMACPGRPCLYNGVEYNHGDTFKDDCNTCKCNDGNAACTLMACGRPCEFYGVTYRDGETFMEDCNTCICRDGTAGCTKMACPGKPCLYNGIEYNHGDTFKDDCNTCKCYDGNAACTLMACGRTCAYKGVTYADGESFKDDCNTCMCSDGNVGCTRMACTPDGRPCVYNGVSYNHGETFKDDCNTCSCSDGNAACTLIACGRPCEYYGITYSHGETFMDDCNTCMCRDGTAACTRMACPGRPCQHNGVEYKHGESFKDDCNTCQCNDGNAACTLMACGRPCEYYGVTYRDGETFMDDCNTCMCRDGTAGCTKMACPGRPCQHNGIEYNHGDTFKDDCNTCKCYDGNAACTLMACGRPCEYKGLTYKDGDSFMDECNTCMCRDGSAGCTRMACPPGKPGVCPPPGVGACLQECTNDASCSGQLKCCSNGCGRTCVMPVYGGIGDWIPSFNLDDIFRMLAGMDNGLKYNRQGIEAKPGEEVLTRDQLNQFMTDLKGKGIGDRTPSFNLDDIFRMLAGMDNGLKYNKQGTEAQPGEEVLTRDQLNQFMTDLKGRTGPKDPARFTVNDINRMLSGMDNGVTYNYQGREAGPGEDILTRELLNQYKTDLREKDIGKRPTQTADFTIPDLERMIAGIKQGKKFNYAGLPADVGDSVLNVNQLTELLNRLTNASGIEVTSTITIESSYAVEGSNETRSTFINGTDGTFQSSSSSQSSESSSVSESVVTFNTSWPEASNVVDINLVAKGVPGTVTRNFTIDQVNRMIDGIGRGLSYNDQGLPAKAGEEAMTVDMLNRYLAELKARGPADDLSKFTRNDITRMVEGIQRGDSFNYRGLPPAPGEKTLTVNDLNKLLADLDAREHVIPASRFTVDNINQMIDGIGRGEKYNYRGQPWTSGDKILTLDDLNRLLREKDPGVHSTLNTHLGFPLSRFTVEDINRMIEGVGKGEEYNYRGLSPASGDQILTLDDLNRILIDLDARGTGGRRNRTAEFTIADLERMIGGMNKGEKFNYEGLPAAIGDPVLSINELDELLRQLQSASGIDTELVVPVSRFTRDDINKMLDGIGRGESYNYHGLPPSAGEKTLTTQDLNRLLRHLDTAKPDVAIPGVRFSEADINRMIDGIRSGKSYNHQGLSPSAGEKTLTIEDLNKLLADLRARSSSRMRNFTIDEIQRMLDGIDRGLKYNDQGIEAGPGETFLTRDQLADALLDLLALRFSNNDINRMLAGIDRGEAYNYQGKPAKTGEAVLERRLLDRLLPNTGTTMRKDFTIEEIQRMLDGIDRGLKYNAQGLEAGPAETVLTRDQLTDTLLDLLASRFTAADINRMLTGIDRGEAYNYQGKTAKTGETILERQLLDRLLQIIETGTRPTITRDFTVDEIRKMLDGIDQGLKYNNKGVEAGPGETLLNRDQLTDSLLDLLARQFTAADINRMLTGVDRGEAYNYQGKPAKTGEAVLERQLLDRLLPMIETRARPSSKIRDFTIDEIQRMLDGIDRGLKYNDKGLEAGPGETVITRDRLTDSLLNRLASRFTASDINRMLTGVDRGEAYNYQGKPAKTGEAVLERQLLDRLLPMIETRMRPSSRIRDFTVDEIQKMLDGIDRGLEYNVQGLEAGPGETVITRDRLTDSLLELLASRFNSADINRMLAGIDRGEAYNYQGKLAKTGEAILERQLLDRLLPIIETGTRPSSRIRDFTVDEIQRMLDGIDRGLKYNNQGLEAGPGETVITRDRLTDTLLDRLASKFNVADINRMLAGIDRGEAYNYHGKPAKSGEAILERQFLDRLLPIIETRTRPSSRIRDFTVDEIQRMLDGIDRGLKYNDQGLEAGPGETAITKDQLTNNLLDRLASRFNVDDINRMLAGIDRGEAYNNHGKPAKAGEAVLERQLLDRLLPIIETGTRPSSIRRDFSLDEIQRMLDGIGQGLKYNNQGVEAGPGETPLTKDELTIVLLDLLASRFNRDDINRMLSGMDRGEAYNYQGKPAKTGEAILERQMLDRLLPIIDTGTRPSTRRNFTLDEIQRMLDGIDRGQKYNEQGVEAGPGETPLTKDKLTVVLLDLLASRFNSEDINRMISGIDRGEAYNYQGKPAKTGEAILERQLLDRLLPIIDTGTRPSIIRKNFTLDEIQRMLDGIDRGLKYNDQGVEAGPGETTLTRDELTVVLLELLASRFNSEDINRMLIGIDRGETYNYLGKPAKTGEAVLDRQLLDRVLPIIDRKTRPSSIRRNFTLDEIQRMLDGIDRGLKYNVQGVEAGPEETPLTRDELTVVLLDLLASRFNRDDINRMLAGLDRGEAYNYQGQPAKTGDAILERQLLDRLLPLLPATGTDTRPSSTRRDFTLEEIQNMLDGLDQGLKYNDQGVEARPGEISLTRDELTEILLDLLASRFDRNDINRMLAGIDRGEAYNYQGKPAKTGEAVLERQILDRLLPLLPTTGTDTRPSSTRREFTLDEIQRMLDGIDRGLKYNFQGVEAGPGETPLTRDELTVVLLDMLASRFNQDDINRMLAGIDRGEAYNYQGQPAKTGEAILERQLLDRLLPILSRPGSARRNFTQDDILRMLDGMDRGLSYNNLGREAKQGETFLSRNDLTSSLFQLLADSYGIDDIYRMLTDMDNGTSFNYQGKAAAVGERSWPNNTLQEFLLYLLGLRYNNVAANKPAEISSMYNPNWTADKGVDRNRDGNMFADSCFHTEGELEPYFIVDLGRVHNLHSIAMFNRDDCCGDRAKNLVISTGISRDNMPINSAVTGPIGRWYVMRFTPNTRARYVKISSQHDTPLPLHLCEVEIYGTPEEQVYPNVALRKPAEMSSIYDPRWTADKGVDGNTSQNMFDGSCFHTGNDIEPYYIVDLGAVYDINRVNLFNRQDCCDNRAKNVEISTALTRDGEFVRRAFIDGQLPSRTNVSIQTPAEAQFVKIQIKDPDPAYLHLCEVEVFGEYVRDDQCTGNYPICENGGYCTNLGGIHNCVCTGNWTGPTCAEQTRPNIAYGKNTEMSSVYNDKWTSDKAVDGITNPNMYQDSCFHTQEEINPYWRVDLGAVYDVDQIEIYNRGDCCSDRLKNLAISTGLTRDDLTVQQYINGPLQDKTTLSFSPGVQAQFIELQNRNDSLAFLHVCEVVVNGNYVREDLCAISPCLNGGTCTNKLGSELCYCAQGWTGSHCHISTDNIAYNKPTELSSLYQNDIKYGGDKGVDGDSNGDMAQGSCFHTERERQPYWMVDLGAVYELQRIVLHNRNDYNAERARDIEILVGLTKEDLNPVYFHAGELGPVREIPIASGTEGQYVMVHIKDLRPEYLHLCEVEVYGIFLRKDLCTTNPCRNGGTCTNRPGTAICKCAPGYGGIFCRRDESQVRPSPPPGVTDVPEPDWNGSRIDPAICRRAQCNLPICYLPYTYDCAKYVVCQRTAIGTYVAWKMRCAFGSYWGTGRTWTCERVEDLARQGYVCPTDPCANVSLARYADEDISNCRTYWQCEKRTSKPYCCPPGQAFNRRTLVCESDPHEYCRSPCPLKLDGCIVPGARTEPFYDGNCRTYWDCQSGHPHPVCCGAGKSYDFVLGHCKEDITCLDHCPREYTTNLCKATGTNKAKSYTLADGNCRTYMKCTPDGFDDPYCCRQDYFYNEVTSQCELLEDVNDVCRYEQCPRGYKEECRFKSIAGSPKQFYDSDAEIIRDCAPGTTFAADICTCDGSSLTNVCKAEVWAKFDKLQDKWSVKNYGDGWISVFGDMSKNRTAQGITYGTFDGSSGMEVWRYDHTALPEVTLEITFQPVASGIDRQILVSNCMSVDNGDASFEVSLDPKTSRIIFKGKAKFDAAEISLPYNRQGWNTFKLFFDGEHLVGVVEDPAGIDRTEIRAANLRGDITAGVGALKFGPCLDSYSQPMNNGFTGFVSEVIFSKCIDSRGSAFIMKHLVPEVRRTPARN